MRALLKRIWSKVGCIPKPSWEEKVQSLIEIGDRSGALRSCDEHLKYCPQDWRVVAGFAELLYRQSHWVDAENLWTMACNVESTPDLYFRRGEALEKIYYSNILDNWAIPKLEEAFECWRKSLKMDPSRLGLYLRLGSMLMVTGKIKEAKKHFADYVRLRNGEICARQLDPLPFKTISCIPNGIGHITLLDYYVKMRELGMIPKQEVFVILPPGSNVNRAFLDYWKRWDIRIVDHPETAEMLKPFTDFTDEHFNVFAEIDGEVSLVYHAIPEVERRWNERNREPLLELSDEHRENGWESLYGIGIKRDDWFVSLHVRESGYTGEGDAPPNNHRNSKIETYLKAVECITAAGGWVIRLGDPSMTPLPPMERVFDYALSPLKSDWMDVFLCAENRFYLGTSSGPCMIPPCFGKRCALANYEIISGRPFYFGNIYSPKLLYSRSLHRLLTFREILEADTANCYHSNFYTAAGLEFIHNTPDEIDDLVLEMMESVNGTIQYTEDDKMLNKQFNELGLSLNATYGTNSRIGRSFLKKYYISKDE
jgi:putative glycosyltransferase (TIGR04372 family)